MCFQLNEWCLMAFPCLFPPQSVDKLRALLAAERTPCLFVFHADPRLWHVPVLPRCGEGNESQKCCWCFFLSAGFVGFDASQVVEGILRCPLKKEIGEARFVIWPPVCVATCFGCGLARLPCWQQMAFDVRFKRFGGILGTPCWAEVGLVFGKSTRRLLFLSALTLNRRSGTMFYKHYVCG